MRNHYSRVFGEAAHMRRRRHSTFQLEEDRLGRYSASVESLGRPSRVERRLLPDIERNDDRRHERARKAIFGDAAVQHKRAV